ncbi:MAG: hypothetical protein ACRD1G_14240, partial [Acidimicrobiales bacterium]
SSEPPADFPPSGARHPAALERIAHAVCSLNDGVEMFSLLGAKETASGRAPDHRWVELAWPGPGRILLMSPTSDAGELVGHLGDRTGRIHHLAFTCAQPERIPRARRMGDGTYVIQPIDNLGTRLILSPDSVVT